ncbi:MAG: hypothetical protein ACK45R_02270 [Candidatus Kapaibacterium sp.]|jgi:hypothetical protein
MKHLLLALSFVCVVAAGMIGSGCRSTLGDSALSAMYGTPVPEPSTFTATRVRGGSVSFEYLYLVPHDTSNATFRLLFSVTESYCVIIDPNRGILDTIDMRPVTGITSIDETNDSLVLNGRGYWTNVNTVEYDELIFDVVLVAGGQSYHDARRVRLAAATEEQKASPLVYVDPFIDEQTDSTVTFALLARRNRGASIDYFPSSERLRVEVLSADGRVIFSSNHGMQYLQEVQPVQPLKREELHRYTFTWGGKDNNGVDVPPGYYTVNLILVAKPEVYKAQTRLDWKGRP